jgi:hypothetical protein
MVNTVISIGIFIPVFCELSNGSYGTRKDFWEDAVVAMFPIPCGLFFAVSRISKGIVKAIKNYQRMPRE